MYEKTGGGVAVHSLSDHGNNSAYNSSHNRLTGSTTTWETTGLREGCFPSLHIWPCRTAHGPVFDTHVINYCTPLLVAYADATGFGRITSSASDTTWGCLADSRESVFFGLVSEAGCSAPVAQPCCVQAGWL